VLVEIGGTVGDIEGLPFFEAIRQVGNDLPRGQAVYIHLTLMPYIPSAGELKTKPTQHSVKELRSIGIQPDILLCAPTAKSRRKSAASSALFCNVRESAVIEALDVDISTTCRGLSRRGPRRRSAGRVRHRPPKRPGAGALAQINERIRNPEGEVTIAIVGKYTGMKDAYKSLIEALVAWRHRQQGEGQSRLDRERGLRERRPRAVPRTCQRHPGARRLRRARRGRQDPAAQFARERDVPYFGICFGMQMACIEAARNLAASRTPTRPSSARRRSRWSA
jgi:CTP synthase